MAELVKPLKGGVEWGKILGYLVQSRHVLAKADAILTCNEKEAKLIQAKYPHQQVIVQPHSVPVADYQTDHRAKALEKFPKIKDRDVLVMIARIDPVKNQLWAVQQMPEIIRRYPRALLVIAGSEYQ